MNRGTRIRRTWRIIQRRLEDHARLNKSFPVAPHKYAKQRPMSHSCCKRRHGQPRLGRGICCWSGRRYVYKLRIQVRNLNHLMVNHGWVDWEDDAVERLVYPRLAMV